MANPTRRQRKNYSVEWFVVGDAVTTTEKEALVQQINSARPTLDLLIKILHKRKQQLESKTNFDDAAWQFKLAKLLGQKEEVDELLKLLTPILEQE